VLRLEWAGQECDWDFILHLRNFHSNSFGNIQQIYKNYHYKFMRQHSYNYRICTLHGQPVGFIGQVDNDIRLAVLHSFQRQGIGKFMINEFMQIFPECKSKVKIDNEASLKLFESCGFKKKYFMLERPNA